MERRKREIGGKRNKRKGENETERRGERTKTIWKTGEREREIREKERKNLKRGETESVGNGK